MNIVEIKNVSKSYPEGDGYNKVLKEINLNIKEKEFVAILGKSGSGKSTLMNLIGGIDDADSGEIIINGMVMGKENDEKMSAYRRNTIGFVFQNFNLIPVLTVWENIVLPIKLDNRKVDAEYITELLKMLEIDGKKDVFPTKLSGGQRQRVAIARALANRPQIILADEPTGNLDSETGDRVLELLLEGVKKYGQTLIMITHNREIAEKADRIVYIKDGVVTEEA